jgi:hypothetical protein
MTDADRVPSDEATLAAARPYFEGDLAEAKRRFRLPASSVADRRSFRRPAAVAGVLTVALAALLLVGFVQLRPGGTSAGAPSSADQTPSGLGTPLPTMTPVPASPEATLAPWPTDLAGERVLAPSDVAGRVAEGPGSFLVGGFVGSNGAICVRGEWLAPACGYFFLAESPDHMIPVVKLAIPDSAVEVRRQLANQAGQAVVVRVHSHDPRATECLPSHRSACDAAVVFDSIAWTGSLVPSPS